MSEDIRRDLSRKLQMTLGEVLEREMAIAHAVIPLSDVAIIMIEAGVMMHRSIAASIAIHANDGEIEGLYDQCVQAMFTGVAGCRDQSIARIAEERGRRPA